MGGHVAVAGEDRRTHFPKSIVLLDQLDNFSQLDVASEKLQNLINEDPQDFCPHLCQAQKAKEKEEDEHLVDKLDSDFAMLAQTKALLSLTRSAKADANKNYSNHLYELPEAHSPGTSMNCPCWQASRIQGSSTSDRSAVSERLMVVMFDQIRNIWSFLNQFQSLLSICQVLKFSLKGKKLKGQMREESVPAAARGVQGDQADRRYRMGLTGSCTSSEPETRLLRQVHVSWQLTRTLPDALNSKIPNSTALPVSLCICFASLSDDPRAPVPEEEEDRFSSPSSSILSRTRHLLLAFELWLLPPPSSSLPGANDTDLDMPRPSPPLLLDKDDLFCTISCKTGGLSADMAPAIEVAAWIASIGEWALGDLGMGAVRCPVGDETLSPGHPGQHATGLADGGHAPHRQGHGHGGSLLDGRPFVEVERGGLDDLGRGEDAGMIGHADDERVVVRERPGANDDGDGGAWVEAVEVDELAELELVAEDEVGLGERERVDGAGGVRDLDVELDMPRKEVLLVEVGRDDVGDLEQGGAVLADGLGDAGLHAVEQLEELRSTPAESMVMVAAADGSLLLQA
ncbi:hypothetical protein ABZP36_020443 [Zizania latifolia]